MRVGLAVPLYDEAALVERVTSGILDAAEDAGLDLWICLVDNGSTDETGALVDRLAEHPRVRAVHLRPNQGYGGDIRAGLRDLTENVDPDLIGWAWGDGQVDPAVLGPLVAACAGGAPLAKARRVERQDGWRRRAITTSYALVMRAMGTRTADVNGCPKLLTREALAELNPQNNDWFLDPAVVLGAEARGWRIADSPVVMRPRTAGRSKVRWSTVGEFALNLGRWRAQRR